MNNTLLSLARSWRVEDSPISPTADILAWVRERNANTAVEIRKLPLERCAPWFYDAAEGCIRNENRSFFTVTGLRGSDFARPVILQPEIGYLGILCREFDWMTLGQIKRLMREDDLVNMDTRTVLSCIPFSKARLDEGDRAELQALFSDQPLFRSLFEGGEENALPAVYQYVNNVKMFTEGGARALLPRAEPKRTAAGG